MIKIYFIELFAVSILPGILWVWYFYQKDKHDPEPTKLIVRDFIWGLLLVFPAGILEAPFGSLLTSQTPLFILLFSSIFIVGFIEEGIKSYAVYKLHYKHPEFNEPIDGIIYGITLGLGFAAFENLFYTIIFGSRVGLVRAVLTSLAHASFTGIFGFYLGRAQNEDNRTLIWFGFFLVAILHGVYDFLVIGGFLNIFTTVAVIALLQVYLAFLLKKTANKSPFK